MKDNKSSFNDVELSVIAPKFDNSGNKIRPDEARKVAKKFSEKFGGATVEPSLLGCWENSDTGELMCDENMRISTTLDTSNPDSPSREKAESIVRKQAKQIGDKLGQASVMTSESKESASFVEGDYKNHVPESEQEDLFDRLL